MQIVLIPILGVVAYKGLWDYIGEGKALRGLAPNAAEAVRPDAQPNAVPPPPPPDS